MTLARGFVTLGGLGDRLPAPGSWASALATLAAWLIIDHQGIATLAVATVLVLILAIGAIGVVLRGESTPDPPHIVIDEWIGQWLTLLAIGMIEPTLEAMGEAMTYVLGFILFRVFDILKPWPIRHCEGWSPPAWAVIADDIAAALYAASILHLAVLLGRIL